MTALRPLYTHGQRHWGCVPEEFVGEKWDNLAPPEIRNDVDILGWRLEREKCKVDVFQLLVSNNRNKDEDSLTWILPSRVDDIRNQISNRYECMMKDIIHTVNDRKLDDDTVLSKCLCLHEACYMHSENRIMRDFVPKLSKRLRSNFSLMFRFCKLAGEAYHYVGADLRRNASFARAFINNGEGCFRNCIYDDTLEMFYNRIKANRDIVLGFVINRGLCLKSASKTLLQDEELVRTACKQNSLTLLYHVPDGKLKQRLCNGKDLMKHIFRGSTHQETCPNSSCSFYLGTPPEFYRLMSQNLKQDFEMIQVAQRQSGLDAEDLPIEYSQDPSFWSAMIQTDIFWGRSCLVNLRVI